MRFYQQTLNILKNFSKINQSIWVKSGSVLETLSVSKNVLAEASVDETFPKEFAVYDLSQFLSIAESTEFTDANYDFGDKQVTVMSKQKKGKVKYYYADPQVFVHPSKKIKMPEPDISFILTEADLASVNKMAAILSSPDLAVESTGKDVLLTCYDKKNATTNTFSLKVADGDGKKYKMNLKQENMTKLEPGTYTVAISKVGISYFVHNDLPIKYWLALEPDSKFEE